MATINLQRTINAPIEDVFDWLSTPTNWTVVPLIQRVRLARPGADGHFGLGAIREITTGIGWFREAITAHERPDRYDYLILKSVPPLRHDGGSIVLREVADGTEVTWTSTFTAATPFAGEQIGRLLVPIGTFGFSLILKAAERALTSATT